MYLKIQHFLLFLNSQAFFQWFRASIFDMLSIFSCVIVHLPAIDTTLDGCMHMYGVDT